MCFSSSWSPNSAGRERERGGERGRKREGERGMGGGREERERGRDGGRKREGGRSLIANYMTV